MVSPASGDVLCFILAKMKRMSFHSIGFPSEWGHLFPKQYWFVPIEFPFNWFPQRVGTLQESRMSKIKELGFHSIGFPSEWGLNGCQCPIAPVSLFPFNWFPQRVGTP